MSAPQRLRHSSWESELILLQGTDRDELLRRVTATLDQLDQDPPPLDELARSLAGETGSGACLAVVAGSMEELQKKLTFAAGKLQDPECQRIQTKSGIFYYREPLQQQGRLAFLFPGEGAQYLNMLSDLAMVFPEVRDAFEIVDEGCLQAGDAELPSGMIFPAPGADLAAAESALFGMEAAVQSVSGADLAMMRLMERLQITPDAVLGHSSGEFVALLQAGVQRVEERSRIVDFVAEGHLLIKAFKNRDDVRTGTLIAVGGTDHSSIERVLREFPEDVMLAMDNCPHQVVLCMDPARVPAVKEALSNDGAVVEVLPFDRPYHTEWFEPALEPLRGLYRRWPLSPSKIDLYSCMNAHRFPDDPPGIEALCVGQWASRVRFSETIEQMYADGVRLFLEIGPRGNLTAFVNDILKDKGIAAIATNRTHRPGLTQLQFALAQLAAHGVKMNTRMLHEHPDTEASVAEVNQATPRKAAPDRFNVRFHSACPQPDLSTVPPLPGPPATAHAPAMPAAVSAAIADVPGGTPRPVARDQAALHQHLQTMDRFLEIQRDMFLQYRQHQSGKPAAPAAPAARTADTPFAGTVDAHQPGERLSAILTFDTRNDLFLLDHTFNPVGVSKTDPTLTGIPFLPLAISLEAAAEAAQTLIPGQKVLALRDIATWQWITLERGSVSVRITATVVGRGSHPEVEVTLGPDQGTAPWVKVTVVLGATYPPPPAAPPWSPRGERPCAWQGRDIYPVRLFHGPSLQAIESIDRWAENGVTGTLVLPPRSGLLRGCESPRFAFDPVALDALGAIVGLWADYDEYNGLFTAPVRCREVRFYGPPREPADRLALHMHLTRADDTTGVSDLYAIREDGTLYMAADAWEDRFFSVTPRMENIASRPAESFFSDIMDASALPTPSGNPVRAGIAVAPVLPPELFDQGEGVWMKYLAGCVLSRRERTTWLEMDPKAPSTLQWLIRQAVAKDAVRTYLQEWHGLQLLPPDIEVEQSGSDQTAGIGGHGLDAADVHVAAGFMQILDRVAVMVATRDEVTRRAMQDAIAARGG